MLLLSLRETIEKHNLYAKKKYGQHFLVDPHILNRIVKQAGNLQDSTVIEVGPGPGGLTREILAQGCKKLIVIEQDQRFSPALEELKSFYKEALTIIWGDALTIDFQALGAKKIISNLPYNVSVPLLIKWLKEINTYENLTLMFQKEVADRMKAAPNTSAYGRLSVITQYATIIRPLFDLAPGAFSPPPKVKSTVVQLTPSPNWQKDLMESLEDVTRIAFHKRRKMIKANFKDVFDDPLAFLEEAQIDPQLRAETLTLEAFCKLAKVWNNRKNLS